MPLKPLFGTLVGWCLVAMPARAADTVQTVKIHPNGPVYTLRTIVNSQAEHCKLDGEACLVGWIRVYTQGAAVPLQTIEFRTHADVSWFAKGPHIEDVNFDGYQDISVVDEVAGKWAAINIGSSTPQPVALSKVCWRTNSPRLGTSSLSSIPRPSRSTRPTSWANVTQVAGRILYSSNA